MNELQRRKINCLILCTFLPGSWQKRFVQDMYLRSEDKPLSERQEWYIDRLYYLYREQIQVKCAEFPMDFINPEPLEQSEIECLEQQGEILVLRQKSDTYAKEEQAREWLEAWNKKVRGE